VGAVVQGSSHHEHASQNYGWMDGSCEYCRLFVLDSSVWFLLLLHQQKASEQVS